MSLGWTPENFTFGPFSGPLGAELVLEDGEPVVALQIRPDHFNKANVTHGGVLFSLGDTAMGLALYLSNNPEKDTFLSTDIHIRFMRPVTEGRLLARGKIDARTRSTRITSCEVRTEDGALVALLNGQYRKVRRPIDTRSTTLSEEEEE
jgi:uncharacterized protein (TIGR00369 family)